MEENKLKDLESSIEDMRKFIVTSHKAMMDAFTVVDSNFDVIKEKVSNIDDKIDNLSKSSSTNFDEFGEHLKGIKAELMKIEKVSRYTEEYANILRISR